VGDFQLMKDMGVNTIRLFRSKQQLEYDPSEFNKKLLREMHDKYGISAIMGDYVGAYTVGSGAEWETGTDYTDPVQLKNMRELITAYVKDHRSEPYVLMWLLGNENLMDSDYSGVNATRTRAATQVAAYLKFVNEIAELIHRLDPDHPVAVGNLDTIRLKEHGMYAPAVDVFGANSYLGASGFGRLWQVVQDTFDRPVLITEYGCDAYDSRKNKEDEDMQALYHEGNWEDIELNSSGRGEEGNSIGGVVFEFLDEWWKSDNGGWNSHETTQDSPMAFPDGWSSEEWYGVVSQGDGSDSPLMRQPRKAYYLYKDQLWKDR
jgi:beta-glucuronidase